eukprot:19441-Heterococcus_DN1.PRE.2
MTTRQLATSLSMRLRSLSSSALLSAGHTRARSAMKTPAILSSRWTFSTDSTRRVTVRPKLRVISLGSMPGLTEPSLK